jgi:hypothetical protein
MVLKKKIEWSAGQVCRASLPGKSAGHVCRACPIKIRNGCSQKKFHTDFHTDFKSYHV